MEHKLINVGSYLLIVSGGEINVGDYITDNYRVWKWNDDSSLLGRKKVICHLPLNNSPILDGVDLLPPIEQEDDEKRKKELVTSILYLNSKDTIEALKKYIESQPKLPIGFKYETMNIIPEEITVWIGEYIF